MNKFDFSIHRNQLLLDLGLSQKIPPDYQSQFKHIPVYNHYAYRPAQPRYNLPEQIREPWGYLDIKVVPMAKTMSLLGRMRGQQGKSRIFVKCFCKPTKTNSESETNNWIPFGRYNQHYPVCLIKRENELLIQLDMLRDLFSTNNKTTNEALSYQTIESMMKGMFHLTENQILETVNYANINKIVTCNWPWIALND